MTGSSGTVTSERSPWRASRWWRRLRRGFWRRAADRVQDHPHRLNHPCPRKVPERRDVDEAAGTLHPGQSAVEDVVAQERARVMGDGRADPALAETLLQPVQRQPRFHRERAVALDRAPPRFAFCRFLVMVDG